MSLTVSPRTSAPLAPTSFPAPKASEPAGAPPTRPETGLGTFKDGYERASNGVNTRAHHRADSSFDAEPGKVAGLVNDGRAALQSGRFRAEGSVQDAIRGHGPVVGDRDGHFGGSNWRKGSREVGTIGG